MWELGLYLARDPANHARGLGPSGRGAVYLLTELGLGGGREDIVQVCLLPKDRWKWWTLVGLVVRIERQIKQRTPLRGMKAPGERDFETHGKWWESRGS